MDTNSLMSIPSAFHRMKAATLDNASPSEAGSEDALTKAATVAWASPRVAESDEVRLNAATSACDSPSVIPSDADP